MCSEVVCVLRLVFDSIIPCPAVSVASLPHGVPESAFFAQCLVCSPSLCLVAPLPCCIVARLMSMYVLRSSVGPLSRTASSSDYPAASLPHSPVSPLSCCPVVAWCVLESVLIRCLLGSFPRCLVVASRPFLISSCVMAFPAGHDPGSAFWRAEQIRRNSWMAAFLARGANIDMSGSEKYV